ncbi:WD40 repeat-like protein [Clavulina sp. PMI_390]|nr:WD40 repeat-like protein [Clavulina sp. PMI_390]
MDDIEQFFIEDDGSNPLQHFFHPNRRLRLPLLSKGSSLTLQARNNDADSDQRSVASTRSTLSTMSFSSIKTFFQKDAVIKMPLINVCNFIDFGNALENARIVSVDGYAEPVAGGLVQHRFLVLRLQRPNRKDIWMRVDRRRDHGVSAIRFALAGGTTEANDEVVLSANEGKLIGTASLETSQDLANAPTLHKLSSLFRIIGAQLVQYRLWPENCWFFCSLVQQHLVGLSDEGLLSSKEWFKYAGNDTQYITRGKRIRQKVFLLYWMDSFFPALLRTISQHMRIVGLRSSAQCMLAAAWSIVTKAHQAVMSHANIPLDENVQKLVYAMNDICILLASGTNQRSKHSYNADPMVKALSAVVQGAYAIIAYTEAHPKIGHSMLLANCSVLEAYIQAHTKHVKVLLVQISSYSASTELHWNNIGWHNVESLSQMDGFQYMQPAPAADSILKQQALDLSCLPGACTCIDVPTAIIAWAMGCTQHSYYPSYLDPLDPSKHLLWLCGPSDSSNSSMAVSVAHSLAGLGVLGAFCGFSNAHEANIHPSKLFAALALQLAAQKPILQEKLLGIIKGLGADHCRGLSAAQQVDTFLFPLLQQSATSIPPYHTVIIIEGLNHSGTPSVQTEIATLLMRLGPRLPSNVYIITTVSLQGGVVEVLGASSTDSTVLSMDNIPPRSIRHQLCLYMCKLLHHLAEAIQYLQLADLALRSEEPFQWATTACCYILATDSNPQGRFNTILQGKFPLMHDLYTMVLRSTFGPTFSHLLTMILGAISAAHYSCSLSSLSSLVSCTISAATPNTQSDFTHVISLLSFLIVGEKDIHCKTFKIPTSFIDFLKHASTAETYVLDTNASHAILADGCLKIMQDKQYGVCFNICKLETSFKLNSEVDDLPSRINKYIGETLLYGCQFWAFHVAQAHIIDTKLTESIECLLSTSQFFHWLEVMSVAGSNPYHSLLQLQAKTHLLPPTIAAQLDDALNFASMFSVPIAQSAPHIYTSTIPFLPLASSFKPLSQEFENLAVLLSLPFQRWPTLRHTINISSSALSVAISPNGEMIASGSYGDVWLWDLIHGCQYGQPLKGHTNCVNSVAFSPDGTLLASGSDDGTIWLWDVKLQSPLGQLLRGHTDWVCSVTFSPDGTLLASGSDDGSIQLWDVQSHSPQEPLRGHTHWVRTVAFSPDGTLLASGSDDRTIRLWDVQSRSSQGQPLKGHTGYVHSVAFSPDGKLLASGSDDRTVQLWDVQSHSAQGLPLTGHTDWVHSVTFSPDGTLLASGSLDKTIQLWDIQSYSAQGEPLRGHNGYVRSIAFSPDGNLLAFGSGGKSIQLRDVKSHLAHGKAPRGRADWACSAATSPDCTLLASALDDTIQVWDTQSCLAQGTPLKGHSDHVKSVTFSPDGTLLASGSRDATIQLWDIKACTGLGQPLRGHTGCVNSVAFSPNSVLLASGSDDGTIWLWNVQSHSAQGKPLRGHIDGVNSVAFSPDGALIASGSRDNTIQLWDVLSYSAQGEPLRGHSDWVCFVAFSPDGRILASGSIDGTIQLWDVYSHSAKGQPITGLTGEVPFVAFAPDGRLLTSSPDNTHVILWDTTIFSPLMQFTEHEAPTACQIGSHWACLSQDGWLKGINGELLLWVPPSYQIKLYDEQHISCLGWEISSRVKLNCDEMVLNQPFDLILTSKIPTAWNL